MRDNFTIKIKETLAKRVGMLCSNPGCRKLTSGPRDDPAKALNLGVAAHITAASKGGPRFDAMLTLQARKSIENAIWLCQFCAKLVDNDATHYDVALLRKWKVLGEESARLSVEGGASSPLAKVSDVDLIRFYAQCLNRPAFQDAFHQEGSTEAFDKAMEDTITAINTGCSRLRDGHLVMQTQGIMFLENLIWRQRMEVIVDLIKWIRAHFAEAIEKKSLTIQAHADGRMNYDIKDPVFCEWMDSTRQQVLMLFAEVCKEAGVAPPAIRLSHTSEHFVKAAIRRVQSNEKVLSPQPENQGMQLTQRLLHDFRSPLVAIRAAADLIKTGRKPEIVSKCLDDIGSYTSFMLRMLETVRIISGGVQAYNFSRCFFRPDVYAPALSSVEILLRERGFDVSQIHATGFDSMPAVWIDRILFTQVVFNLLSNAIMYAKAPPKDFRVVVRAKWGERSCEISVCDWGLGIDPKESSLIFDKDYRSIRTRHMEVRGSGLGLFVSRKIIQSHGGQLDITSFQSPTEFTISLPKSLAHTPPEHR